MSERKIRIVYPDDPVKVQFGAGDAYRFLATGDDTDGGYFLVEAVVPPGGGPPPHIQTREEEAFYILEGVVTFHGDEGEMEAGPGTFLNVPKGARHSFRNQSDRVARMLFFFTPAGMEHLFDELAGLENRAGDATSIKAALKALGRRYGVEYLVDG